MGFTPGPIFQEILKQIEEGQLNGEILSRDQASNWILQEYGNPKEDRSKPEAK